MRYNGGHKHIPKIIDVLGQTFSFRSFCPEMAIGLGTPRVPIHLTQINQSIHCVNVSNPSIDVTEALIQCSQQAWHQEICGYIVKAGSPSCGMTGVPISSQTNEDLTGAGLYTFQLREKLPDLPIAEENQLSDQHFLNEFIQHALIYAKTNENRSH